MKASKLFSVICAAALIFGCTSTLAACSSDSEGESQQQTEGLTGGVAATVNGVEIEEDTITTYIQNIRTYYGYTEEDAWGEYLASADYTPESYREQILDSYIKDELLNQAAEELNITVEESEIDEYVAKTRSYYETDEEWLAGLNGAGFVDEDAYRKVIDENLTDQKLEDEVTGDQTPSDEEVLEYAEENISSYDGAKKSSHILFASEDEATAREVLDKINKGELDFAEAAKEYSTDEVSAEDGGNVGWDKLTSFVTEYTDALATLEKDQVSDLVTSTYGIHIIKCTDVFVLADVIAEEGTEAENAPESTGDDAAADDATTDEADASAEGAEAAADGTDTAAEGTDTRVTITSLSDLPEEFVEAFTNTVKSTKENEAYNTWYEEYKEAADIVINDMPEDVPYNVDMTKYETTDEGTDGTGISEETDGDTDAADGTDATKGTDTTDGIDTADTTDGTGGN